MPISQTIQQLKNYSGPLGLTLHTGATEEQLLEVERCYGVMLPDDFKELYRFTDGFETEEDDFNLISLTEIMSNKKENEPLWIAEYLIYCDMWALEIYPDNSNAYGIVNVGADQKITLTNSLSEFIQALLNNGVFGDGGIYHLQEAAELKFLNNVRPGNTATLLQVFYHGLIYNIVSEEEVINWADTVISEEDEPHYFVLELSLGHNIDKLLSALTEYMPYKTFGTIMVRALYGIAYHKLTAGSLSYGKAFEIVYNYDFYSCLNGAELNKLNSPDGGLFAAQSDKEKTVLLSFLSYYKEFNLSNYKQWAEINWRIEVELKAAVSAANSKLQNDSEISHAPKMWISSKNKLVIIILAWLAVWVLFIKLIPDSFIWATLACGVNIFNTIAKYKRWV